MLNVQKENFVTYDGLSNLRRIVSYRRYFSNNSNKKKKIKSYKKFTSLIVWHN